MTSGRDQEPEDCTGCGCCVGCCWPVLVGLGLGVGVGRGLGLGLGRGLGLWVDVVLDGRLVGVFLVVLVALVVLMARVRVLGLVVVTGVGGTGGGRYVVVTAISPSAGSDGFDDSDGGARVSATC